MADILKENKSGLVLTRNDNVLKTAVILSFAAITMTGIVSYHVASSIKEAALINKETAQINAHKEMEIAKYNAQYNDVSNGFIMDKFTSCIQTIMNESLKGGKFLPAKEAKEVCKDHRANKQ